MSSGPFDIGKGGPTAVCPKCGRTIHTFTNHKGETALMSHPLPPNRACEGTWQLVKLEEAA